MDEGIVEFSLLDENENRDKSIRFETDTGISPSKMFREKSNQVNWVRLDPNDAGILPENRFSEKSSNLSVVTVAMSDGRVPVS